MTTSLPHGRCRHYERQASEPRLIRSAGLLSSGCVRLAPQRSAASLRGWMAQLGLRPLKRAAIPQCNRRQRSRSVQLHAQRSRCVAKRSVRHRGNIFRGNRQKCEDRHAVLADPDERLCVSPQTLVAQSFAPLRHADSRLFARSDARLRRAHAAHPAANPQSDGDTGRIS